MIRGMDASSMQGELPVAELKAAGIEFVILKAQQGNDGFDPMFVKNARACAAGGLVVYAYCFAYPLRAKRPGDNRDPIEQARLFVDRILAAYPEALENGKPLFLDFEWPEYGDWGKPEWRIDAAFINEWMKACCEAVYAATGVMPVIYTYPFWWKMIAAGADVSWAADYDLWLASYTRSKWPEGSDEPITLPKPWPHATWWQWDGNGGLRMPNGVDADFCVYLGGDVLPGTEEAAPDTQPYPEHFDIVHPAVPLPDRD